jgi:hypothetical protein
MLHRLLAAALILPGLFAAPALAVDLVNGTLPSDIRIEAAEPGLFRVTTHARRYQTNLLGSAVQPRTVLHQLLEIEQSSVRIEGPEVETQFESGTVTVRAFPLTHAGKGAQSFEIKIAGDEILADGPYLTVTRNGCCVEQPTHAVFSLESGAYLFNATGNGPSGTWVTLGARGGLENTRMIAQHVAPSAEDGAIFGGHKNAVAVITYAGRVQPLQRLAVIAPQAVIDGDAMLNWFAEPVLISAEMPKGGDHLFMEREGKGAEIFTGATYRLTLDETTTIEVPIVADRFDITAATLPEGYSLVELPLVQPY